MGSKGKPEISTVTSCPACRRTVECPTENPAAMAAAMLGSGPGAAVCSNCGAWALRTPQGAVLAGDSRTIPVPPNGYAWAAQEALQGV